MHYVGKLLNGQVFDSSYERQQAFDFRLGVGDVIKGWDVGLQGLKKGAHVMLYCPPDYAYGEEEMGSKIPANSTLTFEVEIIDWE